MTRQKSCVYGVKPRKIRLLPPNLRKIKSISASIRPSRVLVAIRTRNLREISSMLADLQKKKKEDSEMEVNSVIALVQGINTSSANYASPSQSTSSASASSTSARVAVLQLQNILKKSKL